MQKQDIAQKISRAYGGFLAPKSAAIKESGLLRAAVRTNYPRHLLAKLANIPMTPSKIAAPRIGQANASMQIAHQDHAEWHSGKQQSCQIYGPALLIKPAADCIVVFQTANKSASDEMSILMGHQALEIGGAAETEIG